MSQQIPPHLLTSRTNFIDGYSAKIDAVAQKITKTEPNRLQQCLRKVGNCSLKPLWHKIEAACISLQAKLANMLSKLTHQEHPSARGDGQCVVENMITDPMAYQVQPSMVLRLITSGTVEANGAMGAGIIKHLEKKPDSALFSSENITLSADNGRLLMIFANPKDLPLHDAASGCALILDKRLATSSEFDGSRIVELLKNKEFTFNNLNDLCRKMTMCPHLNVTQITTAEALAISLNANPKHDITTEPKYNNLINMLVSKDQDSQSYRANLKFDIAQGIDYWQSGAAITPDKPDGGKAADVTIGLPLISPKPQAYSIVANRRTLEQQETGSAGKQAPGYVQNRPFKPLIRSDQANAYQPVYPGRPINNTTKPPIAPKPKALRANVGRPQGQR